jgi:hypothetical protein
MGVKNNIINRFKKDKNREKINQENTKKIQEI